jgi:hypothetical protein
MAGYGGLWRGSAGIRLDAQAGIIHADEPESDRGSVRPDLMITGMSRALDRHPPVQELKEHGAHLTLTDGRQRNRDQLPERSCVME